MHCVLRYIPARFVSAGGTRVGTGALMTGMFRGLNRAAGAGALAFVTAAAGLAVGIGPAGAAPTNRYVATTGSDGSGESVNDCTVQASPCRHIQYAVNEAGAGDTIHVKAGKYDEGVRIRKSLTLLGDGATGANRTLVDGNDDGPSIWVDGVDVSAPTVVTIRNMAIDGNESDDGVFVDDATVHLIDSRAAGNDTDGVNLVGQSTATIQNSTVSQNGGAGVTAGGLSETTERVA